MKRPDPPYLGLNFYFARADEADAFSSLFKTLLRLGAQFCGEATLRRGDGIRGEPFAAITDSPLPQTVTLDNATLLQLLADPDVRVIQVLMEGAIGTPPDATEILSYTSISPQASNTDQHPLAIWSEGELFSGPFKHTRRTQLEGRRVYERFRDLVAASRPDYAAITNEMGLECPTDLRRDPRSYAFKDFYVSEDFLGRAKLVKLHEWFQDAYREELADGVYISCNRAFNPNEMELESEEAQWRSLRVAKLISSVRL